MMTSPSSSVDREDDDLNLCEELEKRNVPILGREHLVLRHVVGRGFFSHVHLAEWDGILVAVKTLADSPHRTKSNQSLFLSEVGILSKLRHPRVLQLLGVMLGSPTDPTALSIVTEYMAGGTLHALVRSPRWEPLEGRRFYNVAIGVCRGMAYLHHTNVLHRDLTSKNILLDLDEGPKLADFGVSRVAQDDYLTHPVGALPYVAPEVYLHHCYSTASDVYSMAMVCYEMLSGADPNGTLKPKEMAEAVVSRNYRPTIPASVSNGLRAIVESCWASEAALRPTFKVLTLSLSDLLQDNADDGYVEKFEV